MKALLCVVVLCLATATGAAQTCNPSCSGSETCEYRPNGNGIMVSMCIVKPASTAWVQSNLDGKAPVASPTFTGTVSGITKAMVGLGNVDNTSDASKPVSAAAQSALNAKQAALGFTAVADTVTVNGHALSANVTVTQGDVGLGSVDNTSDTGKPVSTAQQTALDLKANLASPTFTGTVNGVTATMVGLGNVDNTSDAGKPVSTATQTALNAKQAALGFTPVANTLTVNGHALSGNVTVTKSDVGLGSVDNTSDTGKPVSTAQQTALDLKANLASPTFTGTVNGITKTMVGLGSVDNTSDAGKPVSTAQQTALNLKANLASPTFTGTVTIPTGASITAPSGLVKGDVGLGSVDNTSDANKPVSSATQTALNAKAATSTTVNGQALSSNVTITADGILPTQTGNSGKFLTTNGTASSWGTPAGSGATYDFARVTSSDATTTGQALVDVTGLTLPLLANSTYEFEASLSVASSSTAGTQYGVNFSAAGGSVEAIITGTLASATQQTKRISALNTATIAFVVVAADGGIVIKGVITVGANPGNLTIKHLKVTSGTSTVRINSLLKAVKIA